MGTTWWLSSLGSTLMPKTLKSQLLNIRDVHQNFHTPLSQQVAQELLALIQIVLQVQGNQHDKDMWTHTHIYTICLYWAYTQPRLWMSRDQTVDQTCPPTGCMLEPGEPSWRVPWAPPNHPIYRGRRPHTSHSFARVSSHWYRSGAAAVGFHHRSSTTRPLATNTEWSRTSVITGLSTWVTGSVCYLE
jgi:hypothetical protein